MCRRGGDLFFPNQWGGETGMCTCIAYNMVFDRHVFDGVSKCLMKLGGAFILFTMIFLSLNPPSLES